ncbi:PH and SEC7 domain-containing protein C26F1.01 [Termitomyces sp. T112]|nr:PH and SEC7 domain-containing protein C26F1.01 [Termitomyces sp. T112]
MVGRSAKLARQSPPPSIHSPPYDHSSILAETTTTRTEVVTTTTTTTHFFSFPLWKKRSPTSNSLSRQSTLDVQTGADEHGTLSSTARSSFYVVEKDLPPIPADGPALSASQRPGPSISADSILRSAPLRTVSSTVRSIPSRQSTSALAQASLEVGLSPILPRTSSSSSSSNEINTAALTSPPSPSRPWVTQSRLRKSKSAQKLGATVSLDPNTYTEYRRNRGISFNGSTLLTIGKNDAKVKNRERQEHLDPPSTPSPFHFTSKGLARKTSFWPRRKLQPQDVQVDPPSMEHTPTSQSSQLPVPPLISPFNMDITITSPSNSTVIKQKGAHTRGLSRSHSAHSSLRLPPSEIKGDLPQITPSPSVPSLPLTQQSAGPVHGPIVSEENAPKCRPRAQTNPPLLNRLSLGWFSSSSPSLPSLPRLSGHPAFARPQTISPTLVSTSKGRQRIFLPSAESPTSRPLSGLSVDKEEASVTIPLPSDNEEPFQYLRRLRATVSKAEVAGILASSSEAFYAQALRVYIREFDFVGDPLDVALRKLLMDVGLPRETQQIDRVIETFAKRYLQCNPSLFSSDDHPYILAFSLIMLHTDAFNKSNKRKMSKTDYLKNTQLPGIFPEVLICFYDNIVFAPFIFIEDPLDFNGQRGIAEGYSHSTTASANSIVASSTPILKATKIDPYYLIANDLLGPLRIDVDSLIPRENPYFYEGTAGPWDEAQLQRSFAMANQVEVSVADTGRSSPFFSKGTISGIAGSSGSSGVTTPAVTPIPAGEIWSLKLTKVGLLSRKDVLEGGRKAANRKWKYWSVVLTGSQLLFFRDLSWANFLLSSSPEKQKLHPRSGFLRPDELLSVRGAVAVYDKSYTRHDNTFRFVLSNGRQLLLQASTEKELNEWIAGINYASAFKTAGVRMRPPEMSKTDVQLTGVAAATSHLHDLQTRSIKPHIWNDDTPCDLMKMLSNDTALIESRPIPNRKLVVTNTENVDLEVPTAPEIDGAEQFKATFDEVKADLAAGFMTSNGQQVPPADASSKFSHPHEASLRRETSRLPSRTSIIQSKIDDLDSRIASAQAQLDTNLRLARNIATLTPFQKSTRDQLLVAVQDLAQRVVQARLEITRLSCHRDVLSDDIASEWRSWRRAKTIALQAATEKLQNRHKIVPRMTFSQPASDPIDIHLIPKDSVFSHSFDSSPSRKSESSLGESFYSAMDFGPDWPSSEEAPSKYLGTNHLFDSPPPSASSSVHSHTAYDGDLEPLRHSSTLPLPCSRVGSPHSSRDLLSNEKIYPASEAPDEEAEDWNQTRCAQRVSLVRLPSDFQLKARFGRHNQQVTNPKS